MHAAIVELNTLTNAIRPAAEDHDLRAVGWIGFALGFVGRVQIGRIRFKLRRTGVHSLETGSRPAHVASAGRPTLSVCISWGRDAQKLANARRRTRNAWPAAATSGVMSSSWYALQLILQRRISPGSGEEPGVDTGDAV